MLLDSPGLDPYGWENPEHTAEPEFKEFFTAFNQSVPAIIMHIFIPGRNKLYLYSELPVILIYPLISSGTAAVSIGFYRSALKSAA